MIPSDPRPRLSDERIVEMQEHAKSQFEMFTARAKASRRYGPRMHNEHSAAQQWELVSALAELQRARKVEQESAEKVTWLESIARTPVGDDHLRILGDLLKRLRGHSEGA